MSEFITKDSGQRQQFESGMVRDVQEGKPRYDLIPLMPLKRLAELYSRGADKYGDRNWQKANSTDELDRMKASAFRHFMQWLNGEDDEDHAIGAVWNIFAALWLEEKLKQTPPALHESNEWFRSEAAKQRAKEEIRRSAAGILFDPSGPK